VQEADVVAQSHIATPEQLERIKTLLADVLGDPALAATIDDDTSIVGDLGLDSIQMINFLLRLEDEFDIELEFEELSLDQVDSLRQLAGFVAGAGAR
jgi:acyl carrier protein